MFYGNWYPNSRWEEINRDYMERYGTTDFDEIDRMKKFADKQIEIETDSRVEAKLEEMLPELQQKAYVSAIKQLKAEALIEKGKEIFEISSFLSDTITVDGNKLDKSMFISERPVTDPAGEDVRLYFDDLHSCWSVNVKDGKPKLISRFVVESCFIVDARGPGECHAFIVFLKGESKPLVFWGGSIDYANLRKQTQFHQKGLSYSRRELYKESFVRALCMCRAIYFLTLPKNAGWNRTPRGSLTFVNSAMMKPEFNGLFLNDDSKDRKKTYNHNKLHNVFLDIILTKSNRHFEEVADDYHSLFPYALPVKIGTVLSVLSRLLPFFEDEGLTQDRAWVVETSDNDTVRFMMAVVQNRNHQSTEAIFSSMRLPHIKEEMLKCIDCVAVLRHLNSICSKHDFDKILNLLYELLQNKSFNYNVNRCVPVLFVDNAGIIPDGFKIHQLSLEERLGFNDIEQVQKLMGELDYYVVHYAERNPDAVRQLIKESLGEAKEMTESLPYRTKSASAVMLLSTAIILKNGGILTDADIKDIFQWLCTEARSRTSMSSHIAKAIVSKLSNIICSGKKSIAKQYGPPFWTPDSFFVSIDDSINITKDDFEEILSEISVGKNTVLQYLKYEDVLITDKEEEQKTWTVESEDGKKKPRRCYSFSRDCLTPEANRIIDEAIASDLFHKLDEHIINFFPFIKHQHLDMVAGQVITNYSSINPFVCVTGSPGSGKTDFLHMQAIQRAKAGDTVIILDQTNSSCREELKAHLVPDSIIDETVLFWDMSIYGWPMELMDFSGCESDEQKIQRLSSWLRSGSHLTGNNQLSILQNMVEEMIREYGNNFSNIKDLIKQLLKDTGAEGKVKNRLASLFSTVANSTSMPPGWEEILDNGTITPGWKKLLSMKGKIIVISIGNTVTKADCNPLDIVLDSFYAFKDRHRDGNVTLIFDEIQRMNLDEGASLDVILSTGRKLNISAFLASQRYHDGKPGLKRIQEYCGTEVFFKTMDSCIKAASTKTKIAEYILQEFTQGECAVVAPIYSEHSGKNTAMKSAILGKTYRPPYIGSYNNE